MGTLIANDKIKVLATSNSTLVRNGFVSLLNKQANIEVVCQPSCRFEILDYIYNKHPHILIVDAINGDQTIILETIEIVRKTYPDTKVLLVIDEQDDNKELTALKMGVRGILCECADKSEFVKSIRNLYQGKLWIRRHILERFVVDILPELNLYQDIDQKDYFNLLTKRELDDVTEQNLLESAFLV